MSTGRFVILIAAADEYVMEFPGSGVPVAAKHSHKDRLDWVEAGLGQ
jgi:hypothetical protein